MLTIVVHACEINDVELPENLATLSIELLKWFLENLCIPCAEDVNLYIKLMDYNTKIMGNTYLKGGRS